MIITVLVVRRVVVDDRRSFTVGSVRGFQRFQFTWTDFIEFDFTFGA